MKIVKNNCFGGFGLSALAVKRMAELQGKECYFFTHSYTDDKFKEISFEETGNAFMWFAFSVKNPDEILSNKSKYPDYKKTNQAYNEVYATIKLDSRADDRTDPILIKVVEELGDKANAKFADLEIVEIPEGIEYEINEYDGLETIREKHRSW